MRIRPAVFAILVVAVFLAPVAVASAAGLWTTTGQQGAGTGAGGGGGWDGGSGGDQEGEDGQGAGRGGGSQQDAGGAGAGGGDDRVVVPGEVRGWMTLGQIADANEIPFDEILAAFGLPRDTDPGIAVRDLESESFSPAALRAWLAERGAP